MATRVLSPAAEAEAPALRAWATLGVLALAEFLGMSLWLTASAVAPQLQALWGLSAQQAAALTETVQLGFVAGTALAAVLNLADLVPSRAYFAVSAVAGGAVNAALLVAPGFGAALVLRFLTGFFLAGVYPPAMKMAATWFRARRGLAIGVVVGALTVGKAMPYLVKALEGAGGVSFVLLSTSAGALVAAALVALAYRDGPFPFPRRAFSWRLVGAVMRHRETRLAIGGYLGHMWELYAAWTVFSAYLLAHYRTMGVESARSAFLAAAGSFAFIAAGGIGSVLAGAWADRLGRENVAAGAMVVSGTCALLLGWLVGAPSWVVLTLGMIWGFSVVADSAQFSALVTEVAPTHAVGTALTLQTSLGFLLTAGSIWLTVQLSGGVGWGWAFSVLAIGPVLGIFAMIRLRSDRRRGVS